AVELGRGTADEVAERAARFVRTLPQVLGKYQAPLQAADLRHAEGYAVKLRGVTVAADAKGGPQQAQAPRPR
ncbi:MAG: cell division protein FtsQ/DivIB, partial [Burkholderiaceae bacterium]